MKGFPNFEVGKMTTLTGALLASTNELEITVHGQGGHAAAPHTGIDPIVVGSYIVNALQSIASRNVDPLDSVVVTMTHFHAVTAYNVIPMEAVLRGTLRTLKPETMELAVRRIK